MADNFKTVFDYPRTEPITDKNGVMLLRFAQSWTDLIDNSNVTPSAVDTNTENIATNTANIATNTTDIGTNATNISTNSSNITTVTDNFNTHNLSNSEHGVTGNNVGTGDFATTGTGGVVNLAALVSDAVASTVSVTSPDATDLPSVITLSNEMKGDVNQLVADLNNAITQLNDLIAKMKTANQMSSV